MPTLAELRTAKAVIHQHHEAAKAAKAPDSELRNLELAEDHFRHRINTILLGETNGKIKAKKGSRT